MQIYLWQDEAVGAGEQRQQHLPPHGEQHAGHTSGHSEQQHKWGRKRQWRGRDGIECVVMVATSVCMHVHVHCSFTKCLLLLSSCKPGKGREQGLLKWMCPGVEGLNQGMYVFSDHFYFFLKKTLLMLLISFDIFLYISILVMLRCTVYLYWDSQ